MSIELLSNHADKSAITRALPWVGMVASLAILISYVTYDVVGRTHLHAAAGTYRPAPEGKTGPAVEPKGASGAGPRRVSLTEAKLQAAGIATEPARHDRIPTEVSVVGQIQVNPERQVEIRPRASGVVREVHAVIGQFVKRGSPLVTLDSPEIGTARLNLRNKQRELVAARFEYNWKSEIAANVSLLIPELQKAIGQHGLATADEHEGIRGVSLIDPGVLEKQFADKQLGAYRGTLLQAYADFHIASHEEKKTRSLRRQEIVGEHPELVARDTRQGVQAKLEASVEQVRFEAAQEKRLADLRVQQAEAAVIDAAQRLRILGVQEDISGVLAHADQVNKIAREEDVTFYQIVAPFDGTIIKKFEFAAFGQKADLSDILFILADLRSVWVTANVSEADMAKLPRIKRGTFRLTATAYPNREFSAKLLSVGDVFDPQTRTVPLRAWTDNAEGLFKVGMFVRVILDTETYEQALTVPASALVEIEGRRYVFIPAEKPAPKGTFILRPVDVVRPWGDRFVIKGGLNEGDEVVSSGAFLLKSELILQNEANEEE